jgi:hypothetical protein
MLPCLYRQKINANYYGIKRINGKEKDHSLEPTGKKPSEL